MQKTEATVLNILIRTLHGQIDLVEDNINWSAVYQELKYQSLLPMTYSWMKHQDIDDEEIKKQWTQKFASQSYRWLTMMNAQQELIRLLSENNYDFAILKGAANGIYYPTPQMRQCGDVDFLVRWDEYEEIYEFLIANGYQLVGEKIDNKHHVELTKGKVVFEMHKRPGGTRIEGKYANQEMVDFFQEGLNHIEMVTYGKYTIPVLPKLQTTMVLLLHTAQHLKSGLGLRHILDWMMFAKVNVDDTFWYSELEPMAKKGNVDILAKVMTKMCQKYLGLTDKITWCKDADDVACDELLEYVFQQGDFGAKVGNKDTEVRLLAESQNISGFFGRVADSSLYSMPIARKHKILRPVAWIYQLIRYAVKWFHRKHAVKTFSESAKVAKQRAELFDRLGIKLDLK